MKFVSGKLNLEWQEMHQKLHLTYLIRWGEKKKNFEVKFLTLKIYLFFFFAISSSVLIAAQSEHKAVLQKKHMISWPTQQEVVTGFLADHSSLSG